MLPVGKRFCASVPGLIRIFALCLIFTAMLLQVVHRGEFELSDESMLISAVSVIFDADGSHDEPVDKLADFCGAGYYSCHATAVLVSEETGLHLVLAEGLNILTEARVLPGQSVDVPLQPPLTWRV